MVIGHSGLRHRLELFTEGTSGGYSLFMNSPKLENSTLRQTHLYVVGFVNLEYKLSLYIKTNLEED